MKDLFLKNAAVTAFVSCQSELVPWWLVQFYLRAQLLAEQVAVPETAANTSAQATRASETANPDTAALENN